MSVCSPARDGRPALRLGRRRRVEGARRTSPAWPVGRPRAGRVGGGMRSERLGTGAEYRPRASMSNKRSIRRAASPRRACGPVSTTAAFAAATPGGSGAAVPGGSTSSSGGGPCRQRSASAAHRSRQAAGVDSRRLDGAPARARRGPRARHDAIDVVAAAAGRQPAAVAPAMGDLVGQQRRLGGRRPSSGAGAPAGRGGASRSRAGVTSIVGRNASARAGTTASQRGQPGGIAGARDHRQVDGRAERAGDAHRRPVRAVTATLAHEAGAREERLARSRGSTASATCGSSQKSAWTPSPWWTSKSRYRTRWPASRARAHGQGDVVVDAEARRVAGHGVVQAAAGMEGVDAPRPARMAAMAASEPPATDAAASCMPAKAGSSPGPMPRSAGRSGIGREALDRLDVGGLVEPPERPIVGRLGRQEAIGAEVTQEVDAGTEATRREGMQQAEVVGLRARAVDHDRSAVGRRASCARRRSSRVEPRGVEVLAAQATGSQPAASTAPPQGESRVGAGLERGGVAGDGDGERAFGVVGRLEDRGRRPGSRPSAAHRVRRGRRARHPA